MRVRAAASALLAGVVLAILTGCGLVTPVATQFPYAPSDGVQGSVGEVEIINALAITETDNPNANLIFAAHNGSQEAITLQLQYPVGSARTTLEFRLEPNSVTNVGYGEGGALTLEGVEAAPGTLLPVYFIYTAAPAVEGVELPVPVLDGTLEQYADLVPPVDVLLDSPPADAETPAPDETPAAE